MESLIKRLKSEEKACFGWNTHEKEGVVGGGHVMK